MKITIHQKKKLHLLLIPQTSEDVEIVMALHMLLQDQNLENIISCQEELEKMTRTRGVIVPILQNTVPARSSWG